MASHQTVFNHVGLCVADRERSRRFYEGLLGFKFWWELELPDQGTEQLLQLARPIGVRATYLVRDGFVLEIIDYSKRDVHAGSERVMGAMLESHLVEGRQDYVAGRATYGQSITDACLSFDQTEPILEQLATAQTKRTRR